eukprot:689540_1
MFIRQLARKRKNQTQSDTQVMTMQPMELREYQISRDVCIDCEVDNDEDTTIEWVKAIRTVKNSIEFESQAVMKEEKSKRLWCLILKKTRSENEMTESVETAVKWYDDLEHTQCAIDILFAKWPREAQQVILDDIEALEEIERERMKCFEMYHKGRWNQNRSI